MLIWQRVTCTSRTSEAAENVMLCTNFIHSSHFFLSWLLQNLRLYRHPHILRYINCTQCPKVIYWGVLSFGRVQLNLLIRSVKGQTKLKCSFSGRGQFLQSFCRSTSEFVISRCSCKSFAKIVPIQKSHSQIARP